MFRQGQEDLYQKVGRRAGRRPPKRSPLITKMLIAASRWLLAPMFAGGADHLLHDELDVDSLMRVKPGTPLAR